MTDKEILINKIIEKYSNVTFPESARVAKGALIGLLPLMSINQLEDILKN